jgi:hypothetical protein
MDPHRFDLIAKTWGVPGSRRGVLKALAGIALGGLLGVRRGAQAAAACSRVDGPCIDHGDCCLGSRCGNSGSCVCRAGFTRCGGRCLCGSCTTGTTCAAGESCCNGRCVNPKTNPNHCGRCGNRCAAGLTCCGGRCVNLKNDEKNCGACGERCRPCFGCRRGVCQPQLMQVCGDCERNDCNTTTNTWECTPCLPNQTCCFGTCQAAEKPCCEPGTRACIAKAGPNAGEWVGQCCLPNEACNNGGSCCAPGLVACPLPSTSCCCPPGGCSG